MKKIIILIVAMVLLLAIGVGMIAVPLWLNHRELEYSVIMEYHFYALTEEEPLTAEQGDERTTVSEGALKRLYEMLTPSTCVMQIFGASGINEDAVTLYFPDGCFVTVMPEEDESDSAAITARLDGNSYHCTIEGLGTVARVKALVAEAENEVDE